MKLYDTNLPEAFSTALFNEQSFDIASDHIDKMYDTIFTGTANLMSRCKSMKVPTAFTFNRVDNSVCAVCVVQFFENTDKENPGNWNMIWSFSDSDIPENANIISIKSPDTHPYFISAAGSKYGMKFDDAGAMIVVFVYALDQLKKWLDENASESNEVTLECDGIFQARVAVENGEKVFALEADGEIKNIIKDDAAIEV